MHGACAVVLNFVARVGLRIGKGYVVGGWWLVVGSWWLVVVVGGWWLKNSGAQRTAEGSGSLFPSPPLPHHL